MADTLRSACAGFRTGTNIAQSNADLSALRSSPDALSIFSNAITTLNPSTEDLELFHAISGLQAILLIRWDNLPPADASMLRDWLLHLGLSQNSFTKPCTNAALAAAAALFKRSWLVLESSPETSSSAPVPTALVIIPTTSAPTITSIAHLFSTLSHLSSPAPCQFLTTLVGEMGGGGRNKTNIGQPLTFHKSTHAIFQEKSLPQLLNITMSVLSTTITSLLTSPDSSASTDVLLAQIEVVIEILSYEFGNAAWSTLLMATHGSTSIKPPVAFQQFLIRPDFLGALFQVLQLQSNNTPVAHSVRQLLLLLSSVAGPIFGAGAEANLVKQQYAAFLCQGVLNMLTRLQNPDPALDVSNEILDISGIVARLVSNFHCKVLGALPEFSTVISLLSKIACYLFDTLGKEVESVGGDFEALQGIWRMEAFDILMECLGAICEDPVLILPQYNDLLQHVKHGAKTVFENYVKNKVWMSRCEELYYLREGEDLDEVMEEISGVDLKEQMVCISTIGRINLRESLQYLEAQLTSSTLPALKVMWSGQTDEFMAVALLEEVRLIIMCVGHLLTDEVSGETPCIPESVLSAGGELFAVVSNVVNLLRGVAEFQVGGITTNVAFLSPLLGEQLCWFFTRFANVYVMPDASLYDIALLQSTGFGGEVSPGFTEFGVNCVLHYICLWCGENGVVDGAVELLRVFAMGKLCRKALPTCEAWKRLGFVVGNGISSSGGGDDPMVGGFRRLPGEQKANVFSVLVSGTGGLADATSQNLLSGLFGVLEQTLANLRIEDAATAESIVELYGGVGRASFVDIENGVGAESFVVTRFMTAALPKLAALMEPFGKASNMRVVCGLLKTFRDYSEHWIAFLNDAECRVLYEACNVLMRSYCSVRVGGVVVRGKGDDEDEEQAYIDVLNCIELLTHLGTKDFMNVCDNSGAEGVDVTDVIFYGISQITPLMTGGLLSYPKITLQFFELVGYVCDVYPEKMHSLPGEFVCGLVDSLLWGCTHLNLVVGKNCLKGLESICKEHLQSESLTNLLLLKPDLFQRVIRGVLKDVVMDVGVLFDRIDGCGALLMSLVAVDLEYFSSTVRELVGGLGGGAGGGGEEQKRAVMAGFEALVDFEVIQKAIWGKGVEARNSRNAFKAKFGEFVRGLHSFLTRL